MYPARVLRLITSCARGQLDMADLNPKWTSLLPTAQELSAVSGVRVERDSEGGHHAYARFVGQGLETARRSWNSVYIQKYASPPLIYRLRLHSQTSMIPYAQNQLMEKSPRLEMWFALYLNHQALESCKIFSGMHE